MPVIELDSRHFLLRRQFLILHAEEKKRQRVDRDRETRDKKEWISSNRLLTSHMDTQQEKALSNRYVASISTIPNCLFQKYFIHTHVYAPDTIEQKKTSTIRKK